MFSGQLIRCLHPASLRGEISVPHDPVLDLKLFRDKLDAARPRVDDKRSWVFVPYDQLTDRLGPLARIEPDRLGLVLVESLWKARRRPYHKQKLALILANQRQFALEQARRGVAIRYVSTAADYASALRGVAGELGPLTVMRPAERELRKLLEPLFADGLLEEIPHEGWLTTPDDFTAAGPESGPWRMDAFYRAVRRRTGILMDGSKPVGGKFSFDAENRLFWDGEPPAPEPPRFEPDDVTREAAAWVERRFSDHPGAVDLSALPATAEDAERLRSWARERCLPSFGPYEDAMSTASGGLFHTRLSPLLNIHRVLPSDLLDDALRSEVPLASKEGFVRQVVGWREFVRHVSEATDGFRDLPGTDVAAAPGAAGWERVSAWSAESSSGVDGGATPNALDAGRSLPAAYWGEPSGLACLDHVVRQVMQEAWSHHIPRLMVLSSLATLLSIRPRDITDWFWVAFVDAFDWVVEPNVLAMGTFATGPIMTTKPYVSGAAYIDRMSDFCHTCAFDPKRDCPITHLYWAFLARNESRLADNPRMRIPLSGLRRRSEERQLRDREVFDLVWKALEEGRALAPADLA